jgi:hypothetical protein
MKMDIVRIMEDLKNDITKGNKNLEQLLEIYTQWSSVHVRYNGTYLNRNHSNYFKIFGICRLLNIKNIYDIGCGTTGLCHAFLLHHIPLSHYVGIDCLACEELDFELMNKAFSNGWGNRIRFEQNTYPCHIANKKNNIALKIGSAYTDSKTLTKMAEAFSKDFERIIIEIPSDDNAPIRNRKSDFMHNSVLQRECLSESLPNFKWYDIEEMCGASKRKYVFLTKFQKDIDFLNSIKYNWIDEQFSVESVFISKYDGMYDTFV